MTSGGFDCLTYSYSLESWRTDRAARRGLVGGAAWNGKHARGRYASRMRISWSVIKKGLRFGLGYKLRSLMVRPVDCSPECVAKADGAVHSDLAQSL